MNLQSLLSHAARLAYPLHSVRRVLLGPLAGRRFIVQTSMGMTYALGGHSFHIDRLEGHLSEGDVVFDIGANCGQMALIFSKLVGTTGKVISFEPVPRNCEILRKNLAMNECSNVEVVEAAVSSTVTKMRFRYEEDHHTMGSLVEYSHTNIPYKNEFEVSCITLDDYCAKAGIIPKLVKIDVEGAGAEVLKGASTLLQQSRPHIFYELHASTTECPEYLALLGLRDQYGYKLQSLDGETGPIRPAFGRCYWCEPA